MNRYLAIDIGASSGRHIVGWKEDGEIRTKEVYRFPNGAREEGGHLVWDCLLYTSPSPRDHRGSRMPSSA